MRLSTPQPADIPDSRAELDQRVRACWTRFAHPEFMFSRDDNLDPPEAFDTARLRILVCFLSAGAARSYSSTLAALNTLKNRVDEQAIYLDVAYFPEQEDYRKVRAAGLPPWFGAGSHARVQDFDFLFVSHSVFPEFLNLPYALAYSGVPLDAHERLRRPDLPFILYGGMAATAGHCLMGRHEAGECLIDGAMFGQMDGILEPFLAELLAWQGPERFKDNKRLFVEWAQRDCSQRAYWFNPLAYRYHYEPDRLHLTAIERVGELAPDKVKVGRLTLPPEQYVQFDRKVINLDGSNAESADCLISHGCQGIACSFCLEGSVGGRWRQKSLDVLATDMDRIKAYSAANTVAFTSLNGNYYEPYFDLLNLAASKFSRLTLINSRADIMAADPAQVELAKRLGVIRISVAVEGMGDRIRNQVLNKSLYWPQLLAVAHEVFAHHFVLLKLGLILTGQETEQDVAQWVDELRQLLALRDELGARTVLTVTHTPLVQYGETALRWLPRLAAKDSWGNDKAMTAYAHTLRDMGIRTSFNGRGVGTFLEQFFLDTGRASTDLVVHLSLHEELLFFRTFIHGERAKLERTFARFGVDPEVIFPARGVDELFPSDVLEFVPAPMLKAWQVKELKRDFSEAYCLRSLAMPQAKCKACGFCESATEIKAIVKRPVGREATTTSVDQVLSTMAGVRPAATTRFVLERPEAWRMIDRAALKHLVTSQFLRRSEVLRDGFYAVGPTSFDQAGVAGQKAWFAGQMAFDVTWKLPAYGPWVERHLLPLVAEVNEVLTVAQILRVEALDRGGFDAGAKLGYLGLLQGVTQARLRARLAGFDWQVRVCKRRRGVELKPDLVPAPELAEGLLAVPSLSGGCWVWLTLPAGFNPYLVISSILRSQVETTLDYAAFEAVEHGVDVPGATCRCGRAGGHYSYLTGRVIDQCWTCQGRRALYGRSRAEGSGI